MLLHFKSLLRRMGYKAWKLFFVVVVFGVITHSSYGASNEDLKKLAAANNNLGLNLYHLLVKETSGNVFFSPFSLSSALGMLFAGSKGSTAEQLRSALGYNAADLKSSNVPAAFNEYLNLVIPKDQSPNPEYVLNIADELLLSKNLKVNPDYKKQVQDLFHAYIEEVDFKKNSAQIKDEVNNWVKEQTHGKISKILSTVNPSTVMLVLNAIYFKGNWKEQFNKKSTKDGDFYNDGSKSNSKKVPLMHLTTKLRFADTGDLKALELPYKGDNISMVVLLPNQPNGLTKLENNINPKKLANIMDQMYKVEVIVTFPKFKLDYDRTMNSDLSSLGATDIFDPSSANFAGITPDKGLFVNQVMHKAVIDVNEEGSEAAAATAVGTLFIGPAPPPLRMSFTADHPFMFAIMDKRNDLILFLGRVNEL